MVAPHDAGHGRDAASLAFGSDLLAGVGAVDMVSGKLVRLGYTRLVSTR